MFKPLVYGLLLQKPQQTNKQVDKTGVFPSVSHGHHIQGHPLEMLGPEASKPGCRPPGTAAGRTHRDLRPVKRLLSDKEGGRENATRWSWWLEMLEGFNVLVVKPTAAQCLALTVSLPTKEHDAAWRSCVHSAGTGLTAGTRWPAVLSSPALLSITNKNCNRLQCLP